MTVMNGFDCQFDKICEKLDEIKDQTPVNPCLYVVVNSGLEMSAGKVAAQVAHAVSGLFHKYGMDFEWSERDPRTVIILSGCEYKIRNFRDYLHSENIGLRTYEYIDEGSDFQMTAMAIEPINKFNPRSQLIMGQFPLWGDEMDIYVKRIGKIRRELCWALDKYDMGIKYFSKTAKTFQKIKRILYGLDEEA